MKIITSIFSLAFFLVFGVFAYTQEPSDTKKPQQQEEQKPEAKSKQMKPEQQAKPGQEEARPSEARPSREAKPEAQGKEERPQTEEQPQRQEGARRPQQEHEQQHAAQSAQGRQAGRGGHIPDDKFHSSFGRQHTFVISRPVVVDNQPRFQYGGYWFEIVDPWPEDWAYTDDCYVDYVDGEYFLFDSLHPGVRVAVFVVE